MQKVVRVCIDFLRIYRAASFDLSHHHRGGINFLSLVRACSIYCSVLVDPVAYLNQSDDVVAVLLAFLTLVVLYCPVFDFAIDFLKSSAITELFLFLIYKLEFAAFCFIP